MQPNYKDKMSATEKTDAAKKTLAEATRLMDNAKKELVLAKKHGKEFQDVKHMRLACGAAYLSVLKAVDGIFILRNVPIPKGRRSIEYYKDGLSKIDKKTLTSLNVAYALLHLDGYYDGLNHVKTISSGFEEAENIIKKLRQSI